MAKVQYIRHDSGEYIAVLQARNPDVGEFEFTFQDTGDFREGEHVKFMWDGKNKSSVTVDTRWNSLVGLYFLLSAVLLMVLFYLQTISK